MSKKHRNHQHSGAVAVRHLTNDTIVNVAQLLQEQVGATRRFVVELDWFALDTDLMARDVTANVELMRVAQGIMLRATISGTAMIECVRCLEMYDQPFTAEAEQLYRPILDLHHGFVVGEAKEDGPDGFEGDTGEIDDINELDFAEPFRQFAILNLPMQPTCGEECPGPPVDLSGDEEGDRRFAPLAALLEDAPEAEDENQ